LEPQDDAPAVAPPWGLWATSGFSLVVAAVFVFIQLALAAVFVAAEINLDTHGEVARDSRGLWNNGLFLSVATTASALLCGGLVIFFAWLKKRITVKQYLQLNEIQLRELARWIGVVLVFVLLWDVSMWLFGRESVPRFFVHAYQTAHILPLFWFALVIAAPVFEELFFRGFLFEGLRHSRVGALGAVLLTSLLWAVIHLQYQTLEIAGIFVVGVLLAVARLRTKSLYTSMAMHVLINLIGVIEVSVYINLLPETA
jgi:uncharacterized protein